MHLIRAYISCGKLQEAEDKLDKLEQTKQCDEERCVLKALLLKKQEKTEEALRLLEASTEFNSLDYFLLLGDLYWETEMWIKSVRPYLKVAAIKHCPSRIH